MIDLNNQMLSDDRASGDLNLALASCERASEDGIEEIIFTLRVSQSSTDDAQRSLAFERRLCQLRARLSDNPEIALTIGCGYEMTFSADLPERLRRRLFSPTINESNYILIGLPSLAALKGYEKAFGEIIADGYAPIMTHPECSRMVRRNRSIIGNLIKIGCFIQVDALSVTGGYNAEIEIFTRQLLERGQVHFIATRARRHTRREASLSAAYDRAGQIIGRGAARFLVKENPSVVLANAPAIGLLGDNHAVRRLEAALNS